MIDTSSYEVDVVVTKIDENRNIKQIDFMNISTGESIKSCKCRVKKKKNTNQTITSENQEDEL